LRHNPHGMRLVRPLVRVARALLIVSGAGAILLTGCHEARSMGPAVARSLRRSGFDTYRPSGRRYDDPLNRLKWGLDRLLITIRELVAIGAYKLKGDA